MTRNVLAGCSQLGLEICTTCSKLKTNDTLGSPVEIMTDVAVSQMKSNI
jgi:hypothetical protein